jgi:hypothetical protein
MLYKDMKPHEEPHTCVGELLNYSNVIHYRAAQNPPPPPLYSHQIIIIIMPLKSADSTSKLEGHIQLAIQAYKDG